MKTFFAALLLCACAGGAAAQDAHHGQQQKHETTAAESSAHILRGEAIGADTKRVLRRAMGDVLPPAVLKRRDKLGFATPEETWFRGPLKPLILDGIEATLRRFPGLLDARATRALAGDMLGGRRPVDFTLWRIVNMGLWGERFGVAL